MLVGWLVGLEKQAATKHQTGYGHAVDNVGGAVEDLSEKPQLVEKDGQDVAHACKQLHAVVEPLYCRRVVSFWAVKSIRAGKNPRTIKRLSQMSVWIWRSTYE
jgi:hypothetical protein